MDDPLQLILDAAKNRQPVTILGVEYTPAKPDFNIPSAEVIAAVIDRWAAPVAYRGYLVNAVQQMIDDGRLDDWLKVEHDRLIEIKELQRRLHELGVGNG